MPQATTGQAVFGRALFVARLPPALGECRDRGDRFDHAGRSLPSTPDRQELNAASTDLASYQEIASRSWLMCKDP